jgi:tRNA A37 methylthiotransferase MiaB
MLFMVTSTHDYQTCGAHIPEVSGLLKTLTKNKEGNNVRIIKAYGNRLVHKIFMIIEADRMEDIDAHFDPVLEHGNYEIIPIMEREI